MLIPLIGYRQNFYEEWIQKLEQSLDLSKESEKQLLITKNKSKFIVDKQIEGLHN